MCRAELMSFSYGTNAPFLSLALFAEAHLSAAAGGTHMDRFKQALPAYERWFQARLQENDVGSLVKRTQDVRKARKDLEADFLKQAAAVEAHCKSEMGWLEKQSVPRTRGGEIREGPCPAGRIQYTATVQRISYKVDYALHVDPNIDKYIRPLVEARLVSNVDGSVRLQSKLFEEHGVYETSCQNYREIGRWHRGAEKMPAYSPMAVDCPPGSYRIVAETSALEKNFTDQSTSLADTVLSLAALIHNCKTSIDGIKRYRGTGR